MSKITFTLEADIDGEAGPDMAVAVHEAVLRALSRASVKEGSGLTRSDGIDRLSISSISLALDDPEAFSIYERREYAAGAALITEACRQVVFMGYNDEEWSHAANAARRSFYALVAGKPAILDASISFAQGETEVTAITVVAPDGSAIFERPSEIAPDEDLPTPA